MCSEESGRTPRSRARKDTAQQYLERAAQGRKMVVSPDIRFHICQITHYFDVWHKAKKLSEKLLLLSKKATLRGLAEWAPAVKNHFWYCSRICDGDVNVMSVSFG